MNKEIVDEVLWNLDYVHNSVKIYGKDDTFDIPFYINKLETVIELMKSQLDEKDV